MKSTDSVFHHQYTNPNLLGRPMCLMQASQVAQCLPKQETQVWSLDQKDLLGEGNGNALQYSCQGNPMDRGAWWAMVHGVAKSWAQLKQLSTQAHVGILGSTPRWPWCQLSELPCLQRTCPLSLAPSSCLSSWIILPKLFPNCESDGVTLLL